MSTGKRLRFDPRTKILLLLIVNFLFLLSHALWYESALFLGCLVLLLVSRRFKSGLRFALLYLFMLGVDYLIAPYTSGFAFTLISFIAVSVRKFLPIFMIGKWILDTTEVSEFVAAMWKVHLPQTAIIPISVVFRYFPTIKEEWGAIRAAMKMRGIGLSIEHVMVPLLMSAVNISEELSAAALCRGLDHPGTHTCMCKIGFHRPDQAAIALAVLFTAVSLILKGANIL